ncbi:MAG: bifunctional YncE family protein/alkaline phosphatase family protein, partial [Sedimentisphaerales bacterium]|nr:bifunctional YncE family protein/alkaline phosphatase family protein [Sedimentisphaerales bacterium]
MICYVFLLAFGLTGCQASPPAGIDKALKQNPQDFLVQAVVGPQGDGTYVVPTTQIVASAGKVIEFRGRPVSLALNPDETVLAVKNINNLIFIEMGGQKIVQELEISNFGSSFCGIVWSHDGATVWATSADRFLHRITRGDDGQFAWMEKIELPGPGGRGNSAPGGLAIDAERSLIYVAMSRNNAIGVIDTKTSKLLEEIPVGIAPYNVLICGDYAYITNWGGRRPRKGDLTGLTSGSKVVINKAGIASTGTVSVIDLNRRQVIKEIDVDLHPSGMSLAPDKSRLYVANANSDTVSVIDTATHKVTTRWPARPMAELPFGSAPDALAISSDGSTLYVALAGNNCLAVMDTQTGKVKGLIPTGWYPADVVLTRNNGFLCVANTKGQGKQFPAEEAIPAYNSRNHIGSVSLIIRPDAAKLADYTYRSAVNMRLPRMKEQMDLGKTEKRFVPVPTRPGEVSHFKHVLYIIKENRTYDQVFGDMPQGNGDPRLCHFGRDITPNHHALAEEFVLLDNFYCNGVLSADGHQWTDEGFVTDYIEKSFGGFKRSYPYDGDDCLAYASSGFVWDHVLRAGLTFRN